MSYYKNVGFDRYTDMDKLVLLLWELGAIPEDVSDRFLSTTDYLWPDRPIVEDKP
jgi:hypothetical protein